MQNTTVKFDFHFNGESYEHIGQQIALPYGLFWQASVVISLTQLFADINNAAQRMIAYTAAAIAVLAMSAGLLFSYLVTAPLIHLSHQMEEVAEMNLDVVSEKRSRFKEIADIQAFFGTMVEKLMVCFLLPGKSGVFAFSLAFLVGH